ncbi:hypothetical protein DICPUDRAFT_159915 [Dictyostelium purpureum]|uniref:Thioredoxin domain-containing protein n=1 Tax=Dictyostelium purpureum TaxID=5786 RepID=F1A599_DICPU|nr:uncharacterized protein DICPUDRAFT_159915 [Dictyostelium purpureum]EGC28631.1 hypothetical protein DICPUDRAFT_159915 [Dictyostelium purpureum]|eukprot:XP_003294845.1 hypothetical protein DICPUDRAFT_159915 [Dictyostelium purpureum]
MISSLLSSNKRILNNFNKSNIVSNLLNSNNNNIYRNQILYRSFSTEQKDNKQQQQQEQEQKQKQKEENTNSNNNKNNSNDGENFKTTNSSMSGNRTITWGSLLVALLSGTCGWLYYDHLMTKKRQRQNEIKTYGTSSVGGPFVLIDENGKPFTDLDLRGKYGLLYFGFTFCPDVCPAELSKMSRVVKNLENNGLGDSIVPVFITIDPWRDTVEQVKQYIEEFHPKFKGLTGTPEQITKLAKAYRVFMSKSGKGDDYLVDHTIIVYLVGPNGKFIEFYNVNQDSDQVTNKIIERIAAKGKGGENKGEIVQEKSAFEKIASFFK